HAKKETTVLRPSIALLALASLPYVLFLGPGTRANDPGAIVPLLNVAEATEQMEGPPQTPVYKGRITIRFVLNLLDPVMSQLTQAERDQATTAPGGHLAAKIDSIRGGATDHWDDMFDVTPDANGMLSEATVRTLLTQH